ncbi:Uncharacterised protein [Candidatus Burarchaeum australiense]|nr:Uncharacterised protein [Candidatus Burarchaeum australiense]
MHEYVQVINLRNLSLVVLGLLLLVTLSYAVDCVTTNGVKAKPAYDCLYDIPGGEPLIGAGKETLSMDKQNFGDANVLVERTVSVVRTGAVSYLVPGTAQMYTETIVSFKATNRGEEAISDFIVVQPLGEGETHSMTVGDLAAGKSNTVSFSFPQAQTAFDDPTMDYSLPTVMLKASNLNSTVNQETELWLRLGSKPVVGEVIGITSPSGFKFDLKTDESGKAGFVPQEIGTYIFDVPHRKITGNVYLQSLLETPVVNNTVQLGSPDTGLPATAALVAGSIGSKAGSAVNKVGSLIVGAGPLGIALTLLVLVAGSWAVIKLTNGDWNKLANGHEIPPELEQYRKPKGEDSAQADKKQLSEMEKLRLLESAVMLSPKQRGEVAPQKPKRRGRPAGRRRKR